jgi:hypothetical protein
VSPLRGRWARARSDEDFAWACLITNLLGVPGFGTLMVGRWEGVPQLALALAGGVLLTWWLVQVVMATARAQLPFPLEGTDLRLALWGGGLFAAAWLWALLSSAAVLRAARSHRPITMR